MFVVLVLDYADQTNPIGFHCSLYIRSWNVNQMLCGIVNGGISRLFFSFDAFSIAQTWQPMKCAYVSY